MARNCAGRSTASVMTKPSVVAIMGWIMPLPFVMPATRTAPRRRRASAKAVLGTRSVVIMARATASKPSARSPLTRRGRASMILRGSSSTPITPVEEGTTWVTGRRSNLPAALQVANATASPVWVAQLALPALITTAPTSPLDALRWVRPRRTGAACTRFCVRTAAGWSTIPQTISAKSSFATCRIPAYVAAYAYPSGSFKSVALLKHHCPSTAARWRNPRRRSACGLPTALPEAPGCRLRRPLPGASCHEPAWGPKSATGGSRADEGVRPTGGPDPAFPQMQRSPSKAGLRARPGLKAAHAIVDGLRRRGPIDRAVFLFQQRRQRGLRVILFLGDNPAVQQAFEGLHQQLRAHRRQARAEFHGVLLRANFGLRLQQHISRVQARVDPHRGHARARLAAHNGPLNGSGAAIFGQQRGVYIDDTEGGEIDHHLRDNLPVAHHHHGVARHAAQILHRFGTAHAFRLVNRQTERERRLLHRRRSRILPPTARPVGLREHRRHFVPRFDDGMQRGNGESGSAQEYQAHKWGRLPDCGGWATHLERRVAGDPPRRPPH